MSENSSENCPCNKAVDPTDQSGEKPRDCAYWLSKTPQERFAEVERLRIEKYGYHPATARVERGFTIIDLSDEKDLHD